MERERRVLAHGAYGDWDKRVFIAKRCAGLAHRGRGRQPLHRLRRGLGHQQRRQRATPRCSRRWTRRCSDQGVACWTSAGNSYERVELAERLLAVCPEAHRPRGVPDHGHGGRRGRAAHHAPRLGPAHHPHLLRPVLRPLVQRPGLGHPRGRHARRRDAPRGRLRLRPLPQPLPLAARLATGAAAWAAATLEYIEEVLLAHEVPRRAWWRA